MADPSLRRSLLSFFQHGLAAVDPEDATEAAFRSDTRDLWVADRRIPGAGSLHVLATGKAALPMIRAARRCAGTHWASGLAVSTEAADPIDGVVARVGRHPVPDQRSADAGRAVRRFVENVPEEDLLLVLLSGGTSALLGEPLESLEVSDLAETTEWLLASGLDIRAQNAVRKHLAACGGGRLAALRPRGESVVLAVSDVAGDDPAVIGSGPFSPDPTSFREALDVVSRHPDGQRFPDRCRAFLERHCRSGESEIAETPTAADPSFRSVRYQLITRNSDALAAIAAAARDRGFRVVQSEAQFAGEARILGERLGELARSLGRPALWLAGGETTVHLEGSVGRGGRNQEVALAAARSLRSAEALAVLCCGTDGVDGPTDAAGAIVDGATWETIQRSGRDPQLDLDGHDAYPALEAAGALVRSGPTGTNVMDVALVCRGAAG